MYVIRKDGHYDRIYRAEDKFIDIAKYSSNDIEFLNFYRYSLM